MAPPLISSILQPIEGPVAESHAAGGFGRPLRPPGGSRASLRLAAVLALALMAGQGCSIPDELFAGYGEICDEQLPCPKDAPVCARGFCVTHEPVGAGGSCRDFRECRQSAPFCVEELCLDCDPRFGSCGDDRPEKDPCTLTSECADGLFCGVNLPCLQECGLDPFCLRQTCFLDQTLCQKAGSRKLNEPCTLTAECEAGLICDRLAFILACVPPGEKGQEELCVGTRDCKAGLSCSEEGCIRGIAPPALFSGVQCADPPPAPSHFLFKLPSPGDDFFSLPFPNDIRLKPGGGLDLSGFPAPELKELGGDVFAHYLQTLSSANSGFGPSQPVIFRYAGELDFGSVAPLGNVYFVDLSEGDQFGVKVGAISIVNSPGGGRFICPRWLGLHPQWGRHLKHGHTYGAIIESSVRDTSGQPMARDADLDRMLASSAPSGDAGRRAWEVYAPLRRWLDENPDLGPGDLAGATVFTVSTPTAIVPDLRDAAVAAPARPSGSWVLCDGSSPSPCATQDGGAEDPRACGPPSKDYLELHARISLPIFQEGSAPYLEPADGGGIRLQGGKPSVVRREDICVALTVPKGTPPKGGWPVVLYTHGTGGTFRSQVANGLAGDLSAHTVPGDPAVGFVTVGFDQAQHASRRHSDLDPGILFYNYANLNAATGNVLQGVADIFATTAWLAAAGTLDAAGRQIPLDGGQIYLVGHSQGATTGAIALPFDRNLQGAVLSGGGGGLVLSVLHKTEPVNVAEAVRSVLGEGGQPSDFHPVLGLLQMHFEPVDPLNYATLLNRDAPEGVSPKHLLFLVGKDDSYTPNATARAYSLQAGLPVADQDLLSFGLTVVVSPVAANEKVGDQDLTQASAHYLPQGFDGHFVMFQDPTARRDVLDFLATAVSRGGPVLRPR